MPSDPAALSFRPLARADLPMLHGWFNAAHAAPWFGHSRAEVDEWYGGYVDGLEPVFAYVVLHGDTPIGMMCWESFRDFPAMAAQYQVDDPDCLNCDVILGDPRFVGQGLAVPMIRRFLREIAFADGRNHTCIIDPHLANERAIHVYAKAGFAPLRDVEDFDGTPLHLMSLARSSL